MGSMQAAGFAQAAAEGTVSLADAVVAHLVSNCYPPVHPDFHPFAIAAVEHANMEDWDETFDLPNGRTVTVAQTIEQLHLGAFIYREDDEPFEVEW